MKPLILVLLVALSAQAQDGPEHVALFAKILRHTDNECLAKVITDSQYFGRHDYGRLAREMMRRIDRECPRQTPLSTLVAAWDRYSKECWADSTICGYELAPPREWRVWYDGTYRRVDNYRIYWTHRTPTFPGFIEWLRKEGR